MLSKSHKRIIVIIIALAVSAIIWNVNASWGNTFWTCLILSTTTFLIIYTPFEIYFSWRDIYFDRWERLYLKDIVILKEEIVVDAGYLSANLVQLNNQESLHSKKTIVVISPGFSDTKESLQHLYYPIAIEGYTILAYDARGIGESKKTGERNDFIKRIEDFKKIIQWIKTHDKFRKFKINCIGISIGALTVLCGSFSDKEIEKIIAISSISKYNENLRISKRIVKFSYRMKGISLNPNDEINTQLSPYIIIKNLRNHISQELWKNLAERVFLIHTRNDKIIQFKNFEENRDILELSSENQLILNKGGHMFKKDELAIVGGLLKFLNK